MSTLIHELTTAGYRLTKPRRAVVQVLESAAEHLTPAEVLTRARRRYPELSRPTVYRTLELLADLGVIRALDLRTGGRQYALTAGGHHHMVCSSCGDVTEFDDCLYDALAPEVRERFGFALGGHLLELYGTCSDCQ